MVYVLRTYTIDIIMKLFKAITLSLGDLSTPVITSYQLGLILFNLYKTKTYKGDSISSLQVEYADSKIFNKKVRELVDEGILDNYRGFSAKSVYTLLGRSHDSIEDVVCAVDPFCYVSHLSAMDYHGLTNRRPNKLFVSSPSPKDWTHYAEERMRKDLGDDLAIYKRNNMPLLRRTQISKVDRKEVHRFSSVHWGAYKNIKGRTMRVSTIGRTFLDMLKNPELCGGINHVLEVFENNAEVYLDLIVDEINQHGGDIDKVRAGYILDERMNLTFDAANDWIKYSQRGGSRKLDASGEYEPVWSQKWCLSLNIIDKE